MSDLLHKLRENTEPVIRAYIDETLADMSQAAKDFGQDLAKDFAVALWQAYTNNDPEARQNVEHLKVQAKQLATIHMLRVNARTIAMLQQGLTIALRVSLAALMA